MTLSHIDNKSLVVTYVKDQKRKFDIEIDTEVNNFGFKAAVLHVGLNNDRQLLISFDKCIGSFEQTPSKHFKWTLLKIAI